MATGKKQAQRTQAARGSVKIPGGYAQFFTTAELSPRRQRALAVLQLRMQHLAPKLQQIGRAARVILDGEVADTQPQLGGADVAFTQAEAELLLDLTDTAAWCYLKSWTLKVGAEPRPLPGSTDEVLDLEAPLYDALTGHAAKLIRQETDVDGGFTVDALPDDPDDADPDLPT